MSGITIMPEKVHLYGGHTDSGNFVAEKYLGSFTHRSLDFSKNILELNNNATKEPVILFHTAGQGDIPRTGRTAFFFNLGTDETSTVFVLYRFIRIVNDGTNRNGGIDNITGPTNSLTGDDLIIPSFNSQNNTNNQRIKYAQFAVDDNLNNYTFSEAAIHPISTNLLHSGTTLSTASGGDLNPNTLFIRDSSGELKRSYQGFVVDMSNLNSFGSVRTNNWFASEQSPRERRIPLYLEIQYTKIYTTPPTISPAVSDFIYLKRYKISDSNE